MTKFIQQHKKAQWLSLLLVILITLGMAFFIGRQIIAFQDYPFDFDEGNHANGALALFLELRAGDAAGFFSELWGQAFYPPGFSWLKAVAYLIFGPTVLTARFFSLASLVLACIVIYFLAREIDQRYGWLAGLTAVILTLTIQPLLVNSAQVMMEAPGLLATFAFLWLYFRSLKRPAPLNLSLAGLLLTLTFFTKFTYGVIAVGALGLMELSLMGRRHFQSTRHLARRWLWLLGPFLLILLIWFARPGNLAQFGAYAGAQPPGQPWITPDNLLFYPRSIILHQAPSPLFSLITLAGLIWATSQWSNLGVRLLLIYFLVGMAVMTVNLPKNPRFIVTIVPAVHLLSGLLLSWLVAKRGAANITMRTTSYLGILLFLFIGLLSLPTLWQRFNTYPSLLEVEYETDPNALQILDWVHAVIPDGRRFYVLNYWDQFSPKLITWEQATTYERLPDDIATARMPASLVSQPSDKNIAELRNAILAQPVDYVLLLEGGPWGEPFWPHYTEEMADILHPLAQETFQITLLDTADYQDKTLLQSQEWETVKAQSREILEIKGILYHIIKRQ